MVTKGVAITGIEESLLKANSLGQDKLVTFVKERLMAAKKNGCHRKLRDDLSSCQEEISGTSSKVSKSPQNPSSPCSNSAELIRTYSYLLI